MEEVEDEESEDLVKFEEVLEGLEGKPVLKEFAVWLKEEDYNGAGDIEELLCNEWDGAYPTSLIGEDLLIDISNFLYYMAQFAVEKVYGKEYWKPGNSCIRIVPEPSYDGCSYVYILEMKTKSVLAAGCGRKTWHFNPETIQEDLKDLVKQLEESKNMLATRILVEG